MHRNNNPEPSELFVSHADVEMDDSDAEETGVVYYCAVPVTGFKDKDEAYLFEEYATRHLEKAIKEFKERVE